MEVSKRTNAEARACGCPVVTTNRLPMTEVGGSAAIYIDPENNADAATAILDALAHWEPLRQAGLQNAARFSGPQMVSGYVDAYRAVLFPESVTAATTENGV